MNKTVSIEPELLVRIQKLVDTGQVVGVSKFFEIAISNELEKYKL